MHGERYKLLKLLREYEIHPTKFGGSIPTDLAAPGSSAANGPMDIGEIQAIIEIDHDSTNNDDNRENEIIVIYDDDKSTNEDVRNDNHDAMTASSLHMPLRPTKNRNNEAKDNNNDHNTNTTDIPIRTPDQVISIKNTNRDDDDTNDAVEEDNVAATAVGINNTGTNEKRKLNPQSRDHLRRKKPKNRIQATYKNNSSVTNSDDDDTEMHDDEMHDDDDDDDN